MPLITLTDDSAYTTTDAETGDMVIDEAMRMAVHLARHLPAQSAVILGLAAHILDDDPEGGCCGLAKLDNWR